MSALNGSGVPVPRMHLLCDDESIIGQKFYVMEWVDGRVFTGDSLRQLSESERAAIYDSMNATLAKLHRIDIANAGLESYGRPEGFLTRQIARWSFFIAFSLFRSAAILAGVYKRALDGNAADANALERSAEYREVAELGWRVARGARGA
jgi:aminoglycoside phosphotransferase (APT) family kinase protein